MSVRRRNWRDPKTGACKEVWMVDVKFEHVDGRVTRVRRVSPVATRRGAEQYEHQVRAALLAGTYGKEANKVVPTLEEFHREFMASYVANNNKPSEQSAKDVHFRVHLLPVFGRKRLDAIGPRDIESFKATKLTAGYSKKSINNQLASLHKLLNVALDWDLIARLPKMKPLKLDPNEFDFLSFEEAERLIQGAERAWQAMVLVALNTGLRLGELMALRWTDIDLVSGLLKVRHSQWKGQIVSPKSGRHREIPLNSKVTSALKAHRHLRGGFVFCQEDGAPLTQQICRKALMRACKRASLRHVQWHSLRHYADRRIMPTRESCAGVVEAHKTAGVG